MGVHRTCGEPDEIKKNTHPKSTTALFLDQALLNQTALLAIPAAVRVAVAHNLTGYALDYEQAPAGPWSSHAFAKEVDGLLGFVTRLAAALRAVGKELIVDMGGTTAASLSSQACATNNQPAVCAQQKALLRRYASSGASSLMAMDTYYGTDLGFNDVVIGAALQHGIPASMLSSGVGSTTTAGCGCGRGGGQGNRSCCAPGACCGPSQARWARQPPFGPPACVGAPCGACKTMGTGMACYNWTATSLRAWATTLTRRDVRQISLFMPTMDGADDPATEGRNATSPFFYDVLRDFLDGSLLPAHGEGVGEDARRAAAVAA